jgi:DNA-binding transcriptional ArsR family regulator
MNHSLASTLLPEYRRRILALLLLRPEDALHGREVARRTGLSAGTVARELSKLATVGLLKRIKRGNQQVYQAETGSPIFRELASILRKTSGVADVLAQALTPVVPLMRCAFIFGSLAQGREQSGSDLDLMLIGEIGFQTAVELLHPAQTQLGREVNPKVFSESEFAALARADPFLRDVLAKPKIFVIGSDRELEALAGHKP